MLVQTIAGLINEIKGINSSIGLIFDKVDSPIILLIDDLFSPLKSCLS